MKRILISVDRGEKEGILGNEKYLWDDMIVESM